MTCWPVYLAAGLAALSWALATGSVWLLYAALWAVAASVRSLCQEAR